MAGKRSANAKKGMRRAYLKMWSQAYINTGSSLNSVVSAEYAARAKSMPDPFLDAMFPGIAQQQHNVGRKEALQRKVSIMLEDVQKDNYIIVLQVQNRCVLLYYNTGKTKWFFVRRTDVSVEMSIEYPSREIARREWDMGRVVFDVRDSVP